MACKHLIDAGRYCGQCHKEYLESRQSEPKQEHGRNCMCVDCVHDRSIRRQSTPEPEQAREVEQLSMTREQLTKTAERARKNIESWPSLRATPQPAQPDPVRAVRAAREILERVKLNATDWMSDNTQAIHLLTTALDGLEDKQ